MCFTALKGWHGQQPVVLPCCTWPAMLDCLMPMARDPLRKFWTWHLCNGVRSPQYGPCTLHAYCLPVCVCFTRRTLPCGISRLFCCFYDVTVYILRSPLCLRWRDSCGVLSAIRINSIGAFCTFETHQFPILSIHWEVRHLCFDDVWNWGVSKVILTFTALVFLLPLQSSSVTITTAMRLLGCFSSSVKELPHYTVYQCDSIEQAAGQDAVAQVQFLNDEFASHCFALSVSPFVILWEPWVHASTARLQTCLFIYTWHTLCKAMPCWAYDRSPLGRPDIGVAAWHQTHNAAAHLVMRPIVALHTGIVQRAFVIWSTGLVSPAASVSTSVLCYACLRVSLVVWYGISLLLSLNVPTNRGVQASL